MSQEILRLVDAISNRSISPAETARLNELIENDPQARRIYVEAMRLEAELAAIHAAGDPATTISVGSPSESNLATPHSWRQSVRTAPALAALAATILVSVASSSWFTYEGVHGRGPLAGMLAEKNPRSVGGAPVVARLAATRNCRWGSGSGGHLDFGAGISSGQVLELQAGLAELNFSSGARLVLEGPAVFRVSDPQTVEMYQGRAAAAVPVDAAGFSVCTPHIVVGNYGTSAQFGVVADEDGADQIHVFEGVLEARSLDERGHVSAEVKLSSLEGAKLTGDRREFARFNADNEGFVRRIDVRNGPGDGLLAFDDFSYPVGPLAMQNGGFGWAGAWTVLEAEDAGAAAMHGESGVARGSLASSGIVSLGNRFVQSDNFNRMRRVVSTNRGGVFDVAGCIEVIDAFPLVRRTGGAIYISFLQRVTNRDGTFYSFELHRGDGRYNRVLCIGTDVEGHGYGAAVDFQQPPGEPKFAPLGEENDDVNFLVIRIDYGEHEQDKVTIYRNPESIVDESLCTVDATLEGIFGFDRVSIGNFFGKKVQELDEIRIGTDFRAVTGAIERREPLGPVSFVPTQGPAVTLAMTLLGRR